MSNNPDPPQNRFRLTGQRLFLILMVALALALAGTTIYASLIGWQRVDAGVTEPDPS